MKFLVLLGFVSRLVFSASIYNCEVVQYLDTTAVPPKVKKLGAMRVDMKFLACHTLPLSDTEEVACCPMHPKTPPNYLECGFEAKLDRDRGVKMATTAMATEGSYLYLQRPMKLPNDTEGYSVACTHSEREGLLRD